MQPERLTHRNGMDGIQSFRGAQLPSDRVFGQVFPSEAGFRVSQIRSARLDPAGQGSAGSVTAQGWVVPSASLGRDRDDLPGFRLTKRLPENPPPTGAHLPRAIYAGHFASHFGHFLLESCARLWAVSHFTYGLDRECPVLIHGPEKGVGDRPDDFIRQILSGAGINPNRIHVIERPVSVDTLIVPWPLFTIRFSANPGFARFMADIGASVAKPARAASEIDRVFLSRARMRNADMPRWMTEVVEGAFKTAGFNILYPETLPFAEQITLLQNARQVAGFAGSALHTLLFTRDPKRVWCLARNRRINANFPLIDQIRRDDTRFGFLPDDLMAAMKRGKETAPGPGQPARLARMVAAWLEDAESG